MTKKMVGIDFHDYSAQVVELKLQKNKIMLEAYNRIFIPHNTIRNGEILQEEALGKYIVQLLETANPKPISSKDIGIILPAGKVFTHIFSLPANLEENELEKALSYEAETVIPFSIQDVYWSYEILEREEKTKKHSSEYVLFAAVTKEIADRYAHLMESIGLIPSMFGIHAEALKHAMIQQIDKAKNTLIIDVGTLSTNYVIVKNGIIKHFFSSNECGTKLIQSLSKNFQVQENTVIEKKEKNKWDKAYLEEIKEFMTRNYALATNLMNENESTLGKTQEIYLTGEFLNVPQFHALAKAAFPNQNITLGDPKIGLNIEMTKFLPFEKRQESSVPYSIYFTNAIGIAVRGLMKKPEEGINLLPERLRETFENKRNSFLIGMTSILLCSISLLFASLFFFKHQSLGFERRGLEAQKSSAELILYGTKYQEIRDAISAFNSEIAVLQEIDSKLFSLPKVIKKIVPLIPNGIMVNTLQFNDTDLSIEISGRAENREMLLLTKQNLENTEFISEVIAPISNYDQKENISFLFKIKLELSKLPAYGTEI